MQQHKARPASGSQTPAQPKPDPLAHFTSATLTARLNELREHKARIVAEVIRLEKANIQPAELEDERRYDRRAAAIELLCGNNESLTAIADLADVHQKLSRLRRAHRDIMEAVDVGEARVNVLVTAEQYERWRAAAPEYKKHMRVLWRSLVELDKAQGARDAFIHSLRIRPGGMEGGPGWPMAGRLGRTESQTFRFGRVCVDQGWLTEAEFQRDYTNAKI